ncbi:MAG: T9SS type A sorting domain-containing protein [Bacteroidia bacterium]
MKKIFTLLTLLFVGAFAHAQITITNADMPSSGDTVRFSNASPLSPVDVTLTGANYNWDFSFLQATGQDVDTFLSVSSTPLVYVIVFGFTSNLAKRGFDLSGFPQVPVSDIYNFFNKSSNNFRQMGYGASISGVTTPISFNNADVIYDFPVNFGNVDSSDSDYSLVVPGTASAIGSQHRVNNVDGWGSVTTPYGTFNALRIHSVLTGEDSLYLDSLQQGFSAPRPVTHEYKWLASSQDIPVLEITTTETLGVETVNSIRYKDSIRSVGIENIAAMAAEPVLAPNPSGQNDVRAIINLAQSADLEIRIQSVEGKVVNRQKLYLNAGIQNVLIKSAASGLTSGLYTVSFIVGNEQFTTKMVVE